MASELLTTLSGAIQGSLSILLVIFYGVVASQYGLLSTKSAKAMSHLSVKIFLPFLLITKVGEVINVDNAMNFVPVVLWSLFYTLVSMAIGHLGVRFLGLPVWVTPAVAFNNTTSLPLLLVQSFKSTGILDPLLRGNENVEEAINRAQSYFLICSVISKCLTFALGPALLEAEERELEYERMEDQDPRKNLFSSSFSSSSSSSPTPNANNYSDHHNTSEPDLATVAGNRTQREREEREARRSGETNETTSLLPDSINNLESQLTNTIHDHSHAFLHRNHAHFDDFSSRTNRTLSIIGGFFNGVLGGAVIGVILGLVKPLHTAFFANSQHGGIFTSWVTQSLRDTGDLFVTLQVILVGVNLSSSLRRMKRGETALTLTTSSGPPTASSTGAMPWSAATFVFAVRYLFWPLIAIPLISLLARTKTGDTPSHSNILLDNDPILWFAMMLMAAGPPAMSLIAMADVSGADEGIKMSVAKLLTLMYLVSPVLAFVVVAALRVSRGLLDGTQ